MIKRCSRHGKVIHEYLHNVLNKIKENGHHVTLKGGRGIAQPRGHLPICICPIWTTKCGIFLVTRVNRDLKKSQISR